MVDVNNTLDNLAHGGIQAARSVQFNDQGLGPGFFRRLQAVQNIIGQTWIYGTFGSQDKDFPGRFLGPAL